MGYFKNLFSTILLLAIFFYLAWGLFAPPKAYYPKIILDFIPPSLHETRLWDSIFLENYWFWYAIVIMAAIITAWKTKPFWRR